MTSLMYSSCNYLPVTTSLTKYECKVCGISDISFHEKPSTAMQDTSKNILQLLCNVDLATNLSAYIHRMCGM